MTPRQRLFCVVVMIMFVHSDGDNSLSLGEVAGKSVVIELSSAAFYFIGIVVAVILLTIVSCLWPLMCPGANKEQYNKDCKVDNEPWDDGSSISSVGYGSVGNVSGRSMGP